MTMNQQALNKRAIKWGKIPEPMITIDFEASSLKANSYPIEIGMAVWPGIGMPVVGWSTLIKPTEDWIKRNDWNDEFHGEYRITKDELQSGLEPADALREANRFFEHHGQSGSVICDGGVYDQYWMVQLSRAAGVFPGFDLISPVPILEEFGNSASARFVEEEKNRKVVHRARADAEDLLVALLKAMGVDAEVAK